MPKWTPRRFEQIFKQMLATVVARSDMNDVTDSSTVKHLLAAAARQDDEQYYQMYLLKLGFSLDTAEGDDLDERAKEIQPGILTRRAATQATGLVVFSRPGTVGVVTINAGTKVKTASGIVFTTLAAGTINNGASVSGNVAVRADVAGTSGNVASGTIIKFDSKPAGVTGVTNPDPTLFGLDRETDDAFRGRLKRFVASLARCPEQAIEAGVFGLTDPVSGRTVMSVKVLTDILNRGDFYVYIDDGTGQAATTQAVVGENVTFGLAGPPPNSAVGGEVYLYLDNKPVNSALTFTLTSSIRGALTQGTHYTLEPASGQIVFSPALVATEVITANYTYFTGIVQYIQKVVDGDKADRTNFPGFRAAGTRAVVKTPTTLIQTLTAVITVREGYTAATVIAAAKDAAKTYINSLGISDDVIRASIIEAVMSVPGVYDINLSVPAGNVTMLDDQIARTTDANVTFV